MSLLFLLSSILAEKERVGCFSLIVFLLSCGCIRCRGLVCSAYMYFLVRPIFLLFHIYYNQNRSALLCKLVIDNSLLAVNSVNYFTMIVVITDLF